MKAVWFLVILFGLLVYTWPQPVSAQVYGQFDIEQKILIGSLDKEQEESTSEESGWWQDLTPKLKRKQKLQVPVLMYHYIRVNPDPRDLVGYSLSVTPTEFEKQMRFLSENGFKGIGLGEIKKALVGGYQLPEKAIAITFDDGYADSYWRAFPVLKKYGFKATNFIITGVVGAPRYLSWWQMKEMVNSGVFSFGAHSVHHQNLTRLPANTALEELELSKLTLEENLGVVVDWMAYPYGNVNSVVENLAKEAGFFGAFGTNGGKFESIDSLFSLPRVRVDGRDTVLTLAKKLADEKPEEVDEFSRTR